MLLNVYREDNFLVPEERNLIGKKAPKTSGGADDGYDLILCEEVMNTRGGSVEHSEEKRWFLLRLKLPISTDEEKQ